MELKKYWEILWSRKELFAVIVMITVAVPLMLAYALQPIYKSTARVAINLKDIQADYLSDLPGNLGSFRYVEKKNVIDTFKAFLKNPDSIENLIRKLELKDIYGEKIKADDLVLSITKYPKFLFLTRRAFSVEQAASAEVFNIEGYSVEPEEAVAIANTAIEIFLELYSQIYRQKNEKILKVMEDNLAWVKKELSEAEKKGSEVRTREGLVDKNEQAKALISQISSLQTLSDQVKRERREKESRLVSIRESMTKIPEIYKTGIVLTTNPVIDSYKAQLLQLESAIAELLVEHTEEHPDVITRRKQIELVKEKMKEEMLMFRTDTRNPYFSSMLSDYSDIKVELAGLEVREGILQSQIDARRSELLEIPSKNDNIKVAVREISNLEDYYGDLKKGINAARIALDMDIDNASIVSYADIMYIDLHEPYFPKKKKIAVLSGLLGVTLAFFIVFLLEFISNSPRSKDEIERIMNVPVLAEIPINADVDNWITDKVIKAETSKVNLFENSFWNLKSGMNLAASGNLPKVLEITSMEEGDGKSIVSFFLAKVLAESGLYVLLVDGNIRSPFPKRSFDFSASKDLLHLLSGDAPDLEGLKQNIHKTDIPNLSIIPVSKYPTSLKFIDSDSMEKLLDLLKKQFDIIIFDSLSLRDGKEAYLLSRLVDKVIVVMQKGRVDIDEAVRTVEGLNKPERKLLGLVLNNKKRHFI